MDTFDDSTNTSDNLVAIPYGFSYKRLHVKILGCGFTR